MDEMKTCAKCGATKPLTQEYWYFRSGNNRPMSQCKECRKEAAKARYEADPAKAREQAYAARRARAEQLKEYIQDYYWENHERKRQLAREYRQRHRERIQTQDRTRGRPTREENRRVLYEWYSQGCIVCGLVFLPGGMQAHHRNEQEKDQAASQLLSAKKGMLATELAKCDVFCATHHFMLTQAKREDKEATYDQLLAMLREHWRETLRALREEPTAERSVGDV